MTTIPVERLTTGTRIYLKQINWSKLSVRFDDFADVEGIDFDGYGYALTLDNGDRHYVEAGETVDFGGRGEPKLRPEADVSFEEWQAKAEAYGARLDRTLAAIDQGRLALFMEAVERAREAPAMEAAE